MSQQKGLRGHQIEDNSISLGKLITSGYTPSSNYDLANVQYVLNNLPTGSTAPVTTQQITVNLGPGGTSGSYTTGDVIPIGTYLEVINKNMLQKRVLPTYTVASIFTNNTNSLIGEVGETVNTTISTSFVSNDAGALTAIRILKNGSAFASGITSPLSQADTIIRINGSIYYQGFADYLSGNTKNDNLGNPDTRVPAVRNPNTPQAPENNFPSNTVTFIGYYNYFYDSLASVPTTSADVRAFVNKQLTNVGNSFILNSGTVNKIFSIAMPTTHTLSSVIDLDALNANITGNFVLSTFNVNDAGGTPVAYNVYTLSNAVSYSSNHRLSITIS